jgi:protein required for attachment to host cells
MSGLKITQGEWVMVCDGAKALLLENVGDEKYANLKTQKVYEQEIRRRTSWAPMPRAGRSAR